MICASLYRPFFIQNLLRYLAEKILLLNTTNFRGDYQSSGALIARIRCASFVEVEEAKGILDKHYDSGFLLGVWHECNDGICYRYADGRYAELAKRDSGYEAA